jgi:hypothetical protein
MISKVLQFIRSSTLADHSCTNRARDDPEQDVMTDNNPRQLNVMVAGQENNRTRRTIA